MTWSGAVLFLGAYLLGSVPFGWLLGRLKGVDIRTSGSGNIGATNLSRSLGRNWGVLAFVLDFAKGLVPVLIAVRFSDEAARQSASWLPAAVGGGAVLGHVFPVYLAFRGGKGVATAFGAMAALSWLAALTAGAVWAGVFLATRAVSLASLIAVVALPLAVAVLEDRASSSYPSTQVFAVLLTALVVARHRSNIGRLLRGEEFRFR